MDRYGRVYKGPTEPNWMTNKLITGDVFCNTISGRVYVYLSAETGGWLLTKEKFLIENLIPKFNLKWKI